MKKVAFIINPKSAKGNYQVFVQALKKESKEALVYISASLQGTQNFIKTHFQDIDIFIAVGGDGTISSVAAELIRSEKILGIFPAGSGNGFANETNFNKNLKQLLNKIKEEKFREIDTVMVNNLLSINVSGTGFDGNVTKDFEKTSRGFKNYIKVSIQTFFKFKPIEIHFTHPDFQQYDGKYLMLNFANTRQFGNNAYIAPNAQMDDGLLEAVLVKPFPLWYGAMFALRMFRKTLKNDKYITYLSVPEISFESNSVNWHIDGDFKEIPSPITVKILPKTLKILVD